MAGKARLHLSFDDGASKERSEIEISIGRSQWEELIASITSMARKHTAVQEAV